jgi:hypothetical protein
MVAFESLLMRRAEGAEFFLAVWVVVTIAGGRRERRCRPRGGDGVESGKGGEPRGRVLGRKSNMTVSITEWRCSDRVHIPVYRIQESTPI